MRAKYVADKGITVIRPLVYVREHLMADFARQVCIRRYAQHPLFSMQAKLPVINENCPACFEEPKERRRTKKLLAKEEANFPHVFSSLRRSLRPLMDAQVANAVKAFDSQCISCKKRQQAEVIYSDQAADGGKHKLAESLAAYTDEQLRAELERRASS